jgi:protein farnesyltransferase/geranylgeranyltransferase type-1 subunit alpha
MSEPSAPAAPAPVVSAPRPASSDDEPETDWYLTKFDWSDVVEVPSLQAKTDPFYVDHTLSYSTVFGRFNALVRAGEISPRALALCDLVISAFSKHSPAWSYKYTIIEQLGYDFARERRLCDFHIRMDRKSYQAWHFRQWLVDREESAPDEISFLVRELAADGKNFHAWSYALWYARRWDQTKLIYELAVQQTRIDCRNNSAWNARRVCGEWLAVDPLDEFFVVAAILKIVGKNDAAACFLLDLQQRDEKLRPRIRSLAEELVARNPDNPVARRLLLATAKDQAEIEATSDALMRIDPIMIPFYTLVKQGVLPYE